MMRKKIKCCVWKRGKPQISIGRIVILCLHEKQDVNGAAEVLQMAENQHWTPCEGALDGGRVALMVSLVVASVAAYAGVGCH